MASRVKDLGVAWKYDHSLVTNLDFLRVTKLIAKHINAIETACTGAIEVEKNDYSYSVEDDDVTAVLAALANNRSAALKLSGRAFQEELLSMIEEWRSDDILKNQALAQRVMEEKVEVDSKDLEFIARLGWESAEARDERAFVDAEVRKVHELQEAILQTHRKELNEMLSTLSRHNQRVFLMKLKGLKREQDKSSLDLEELASESFLKLQTKTKDLQAKYEELFKKAKIKHY